jgi:hypothetical protein
VSAPNAQARLGRPNPLVVVAQVLLTVAGVLYAGVHLEALAGWPLHPARSYLSELAALDQPTSELFRTVDFAAGSLVVVAVTLLVVARRRRRASGHGRVTRAHHVTVWALLAFGAATMADALLPMDCALSVGNCAAREKAGDVSLVHSAHTFSSVTAGVTSFVASAGVVWLAWARRRTPLGVAACLAGVLGPVLGIVTGAIGALGGPLPLGAGIAQRAQIVAFSLVLALAVPVLRRAGRVDPRPQDGTSASPASSKAGPRDT